MNSASYCIAIVAIIAASAGVAQNAISAPIPRGNPDYWIVVQEAPPELLKKLKGRVIKIRFTLSVGPNGRTSSCSHDGKNGLNKDFGEVTCSQVTRRARFTPAKNAQGAPVHGVYSSIAKWSIPSETGLI